LSAGKRTKPQIKALAKKIQKQVKALEAGKEAYARANELLEEIIVVEGWKPGEAIALTDGTTAELVDKFATKNRIGTGMGVNRYEIECSRAKDITAKL
jgi:hypothetical protein